MGFRLGQLKTVLICWVKKNEFRYNVFENTLKNKVTVQNLKYLLVLPKLSRKYLIKIIMFFVQDETYNLR